ncbi:MAG: rod shape-determining protein MreC [Chloroflexota bacterium]
MRDSQVVGRARQIGMLVFTLIVASLLLITLDNRQVLDPVKDIFGQAVAPAGRALSGIDSPIAGEPVGDAELQRQLQELEAERDGLVAENARLREQVAEVDQLREQLGFREAHPELEVTTARVIARDPQSLEKYIVIDRGSNDGIENGMAVVSPNFMVGQVVEVEPNRSRVLLVIDSSFRTGARLQTSRGAGIVYGLWQSGGRAEMRHIPLDTEVVPDELVVTSGESEGIPEGLVIGRISDLEREELGNQIIVSVLPLVDFDSIETVTVITGEREPS